MSGRRAEILAEDDPEKELKQLHEKNLRRLEEIGTEPRGEKAVTFGMSEISGNMFSGDTDFSEYLEDLSGIIHPILSIETVKETGNHGFSIGQEVRVSVDLSLDKLADFYYSMDDAFGVEKVRPIYEGRGENPIEAYENASYSLSFFAKDRDYIFVTLDVEEMEIAGLEADRSEYLQDVYTIAEETGIDRSNYTMSGDDDGEWLMFDDAAHVERKR